LNVLVINSENNLQIPVALVKEWQLNPNFTSQFSTWLDQFLTQYSVADDAAKGTGPGTGPEPTEPGTGPNKRKSGGKSGGSPAKVLKLENLEKLVVDNNDITQSLLAEAQLTGKHAPWYQLRTGHHMYLVNKSQTEWQSPQLCMCAGYGKGNFKLIKPDGPEQDTSNTLEFKFESHSDIVILSGQAMTLGQVVSEQHVKKPNAEVAYHKLSFAEANPKEFTLEQTHKIMFVPVQEDADNAKVGSIAAKEPVASYVSAQGLRVLWNVRWTAKGLMPVKPGVYLKGSVTLPPGKSCHLTAESA
jgi:hypothetical protein